MAWGIVLVEYIDDKRDKYEDFGFSSIFDAAIIVSLDFNSHVYICNSFQG